MAVPCRVKENKVIPIRKNIINSSQEPQIELPNQLFVCANCGFGAHPENRWQPVMETSCCPMCGSKKKR